MVVVEEAQGREQPEDSDKLCEKQQAARLNSEISSFGKIVTVILVFW